MYLDHDGPDGDNAFAPEGRGRSSRPTNSAWRRRGPAIIPELFKPFRQANSKVTRRFGGTGLGLHIVRRLVGLHGGEVTMESAPDRGTVMRIRLPASRVRARGPRQAKLAVAG